MERRPPAERGAVQPLDAYHFYTEDWDDYDQLCDAFEWVVPERFNLAEYLCDRWAARRGRVAVFGETHRGPETTYTYWQLRNDSNRLANVLRRQGISQGDRIGINLSQRPETLVAHTAAWKLGAASVPLSTKFGPDALAYRLDDCGAKACLVDTMNAEAFSEAHEELNDLDEVFTVGGGDPRGLGTPLPEVLSGASRTFDPVQQAPGDEALIHYTSGTTGEPKGVRHGHQVVLGHLPTFVTTFCNMELSDDHLFWTPSEWAWILLPMMILPNLFYGKPLLAYSAPRFDPETAYRLLEEYGVTNYFAPPTALRMMASEGTADQYDTSAIRVVASAGEPVGQELKEWVAETFDAPVQEAYGQTEVDSVVGTCTALGAIREGTIGKATPGRTVRIVDPEDPPTSVESGEVGEFAVRRADDPICFLDYLNQPEKTAGKVRDGWILLGDLGSEDEDGYFTFHGRMDDVIISSGYRIGPSEIEDTLATHAAVADAGVIGIPDEERGEVPKAFVVLQGDVDPSADLVRELQQYVKGRLAVYEYPREIEFIDELPITVTDKLRRADLRDREGLTDT
jgi:acetyl-CoA synthetase